MSSGVVVLNPTTVDGYGNPISTEFDTDYGVNRVFTTSKIQDGEGTGLTAGVTTKNELKVTDTSGGQGPALIDIASSGFEPLLRKKTFADYFKNSGGSENLNVDGSSTPQDFVISSEVDKLKSIYRVRLILHDKRMALGSSEGRRFASAASNGLTNGLRLFVTQGGNDTDLFLKPVKQIAEFLNYAVELVNEPGALGSGEDILTVTMNFDFAPVHIVPGGVDSLTVRVQDDLSNINLFQVFGFGSQEFL